MAARHAKILDRVLGRLRFRQLRLLIAVGQHSSIQNAARELNISQPAATKMIKDLELDFEVSLFDRTNRGVLPTPSGIALIRHAKLILSQLSTATQDLEDLGEGNSGRVVVGTLLAASSGLLPAAIQTLLTQRPNVSIKVVEGTNEVLMPALRAGEIDLVVGRLPTHRHRSEIMQQTLVADRILAVVGPQHPLAGRSDLSFAALRPFAWILPPEETSLRRQIDRFFVGQDQYAPGVAMESVSYLTNRALLRERDVIALMPSSVVGQDMRTGTLAGLDWPVPFGERPIGVSTRQHGMLSPAARAMLAALQDATRA